MFSEYLDRKMTMQLFESNQAYLANFEKEISHFFSFIQRKQRKWLSNEADNILKIRTLDSRYKKAFNEYVASKGGSRKSGITPETHRDLHRSMVEQLQPNETPTAYKRRLRLVESELILTYKRDLEKGRIPDFS